MCVCVCAQHRENPANRVLQGTEIGSGGRRAAKAEEGEDRQMVGVDPDVGSTEFSEFPQPECTCPPHSVTPCSHGGAI